LEFRIEKRIFILEFVDILKNYKYLGKC